MRDRATAKAARTRRWRAGATTGLALGLAAGALEWILSRRGLVAAGVGGTHPLIVAGGWGAIGVVLGLTAAAFGRAPAASPHRRRALATLRVAVGLGVVAATGWAAGLLEGGVAWGRPAVLGLAAAVGGLLWIGCGPLCGAPVLSTLASAVGRARWPIVVAALALTLGYALTAGRPVSLTQFDPPAAGLSPAEREPAAPRVVLLGIDGATWETLLPLVEAGRLPNLERLMRRSRWGDVAVGNAAGRPVAWAELLGGARPVWRAAAAAGLHAVVVGVPGTWPAAGDGVTLLAGPPGAGRANRGAGGWLATSTEDPPSGAGPQRVRLDLDPGSLAPGERWPLRVALRDLPAELALAETTPLRLLRALAGDARAIELLRPAARISFGGFDLELVRPAGGEDLVVEGSSGGETLFTLREGEWSEWITATDRVHRSVFRVHAAEVGPQALTLFVTPLFLFPDAAAVAPLAVVAPLLDVPYVVDGAGWDDGPLDPRLFATLHEHQLDVAGGRQRATTSVLDALGADLLVRVFTVAERVRELARAVPPDAAAGRSEIGDATARAYETIDGWIGEVERRAGRDAEIVVLSAGRSTADGGAATGDGIYVVARGAEQGPAPGNERGPRLTPGALAAVGPFLLGLPAAPGTERPPAFLESSRPAG